MFVYRNLASKFAYLSVSSLELSPQRRSASEAAANITDAAFHTNMVFEERALSWYIISNLCLIIHVAHIMFKNYDKVIKDVL